jgi:hypothetical protein
MRRPIPTDQAPRRARRARARASLQTRPRSTPQEPVRLGSTRDRAPESHSPKFNSGRDNPRAEPNSVCC